MNNFSFWISGFCHIAPPENLACVGQSIQSTVIINLAQREGFVAHYNLWIGGGSKVIPVVEVEVEAGLSFLWNADGQLLPSKKASSQCDTNSYVCAC